MPICGACVPAFRCCVIATWATRQRSSSIQPANWMPLVVVYSASLENHPHHVARLAQNRTLLGNSPQTLEQGTRSTATGSRVKVSRFLLSANDSGLALSWTSIQEETWLWKPLRSGGGHSVRPGVANRSLKKVFCKSGWTGMVGSAAFVANGREAVVVGVTRAAYWKRTSSGPADFVTAAIYCRLPCPGTSYALSWAGTAGHRESPDG